MSTRRKSREAVDCGPCTRELVAILRSITDLNFTMLAQELTSYSPAGIIEGERILNGFISEHGPKRESVYYG